MSGPRSSEIYGWVALDLAARFVTCSWCGSPPGVPCRSQRGVWMAEGHRHVEIRGFSFVPMADETIREKSSFDLLV